MQTLDFTRALTNIVAELKIREIFMLVQGWLISQPANNPNYVLQPIPNEHKASFAELAGGPPF
jgi:hypothetical protein